MNIASLPSVSAARLPINYEAAKAALEACQSLDECKDWADKSAALASYARQAQDDGLEREAKRIRARANRRAGELLAQIDGRGGGNIKGTGSPTFARETAARNVGMSKHQQVQATRIATIPEGEFEAQVESDAPPTLTDLAKQGIKPHTSAPILDLKGRDPKAFNRALHFLGTFENYARDMDRADVDAALAVLIDAERDALRRFINRIDTIHDRIMTRI